MLVWPEPVEEAQCCQQPRLEYAQDSVLWRCDRCRQWWVSYVDYAVWRDLKWSKVRWYHKRLIARIRKAELMEAQSIVASWQAYRGEMTECPAGLP